MRALEVGIGNSGLIVYQFLLTETRISSKHFILK